jgi:hypothetical protein
MASTNAGIRARWRDRGALGVIVLAGCGRFAFDPRVETRDGDVGVALDGDAGDAAGACPPFALLCDDFESGTLNAWTSASLNPGSSTLVVSQGVGRGGTFGLEANVLAGAGGGKASPRLVFAPRSTGTLAVRSWVKSTTALTNFNLVLEIARGIDEYVTLGGDSGGNWVSSDLRMGGGFVDHFTTQPVPTTDVWFCVELLFNFEPAPGRIQGFADDVLVLDTTALAPAPIFDAVSVGSVRGDQALGLHVYVDDVMIADRRIGCQ